MFHLGKRTKVILTQSIYHVIYPQFTGLCDYFIHLHSPKTACCYISTLFYQQMFLYITRALQKQNAEFLHPPIKFVSEQRGQL